MTCTMLTVPRLDILDSLDNTEDILSTLDSRGARGCIDSVNWPEVASYRPMAQFAIAYTSQAIYIDFLTRCNYLRAVNTENQSPVSQDSCVEFFLDPKGDGEYWNFEFNCIGAINASRRFTRPNPTRLNDEQLARVKRFPSVGTRPFCELEGLFTWNLLVVIPLDLIGLDADNMPQTMKCNFYKCASATSDPHYLSWNPIKTEKPDFHRPDFFGEISFEHSDSH